MQLMLETAQYRQQFWDSEITRVWVSERTVEAVGSEPGGGVMNEVISVY